MSPELDEKLCMRFPLLYADRHASMKTTCMCWGFECGDGWYELIKNLSLKLERVIESLPADQREHYRASQVKEKFGSLRVYLTASTEEMEDCILEAEEESARTCEDCGAPGELRSGGWLRTLCDSCAVK